MHFSVMTKTVTMVQIALGYIPILLAQVSSGVLLDRCQVTYLLTVARVLSVTRWSSPL